MRSLSCTVGGKSIELHITASLGGPLAVVTDLGLLVADQGTDAANRMLAVAVLTSPRTPAIRP